MMVAIHFRLAVLAGVVAAALFSQVPPEGVDYHRQVHSLLALKCLSCHSQEKRSGGLSLATYQDVLNGGRSGAALRPGNSGASLIMQRIMGALEPRMPFGLPALTEPQISIIRAWIDQGARATAASAPAKAKWEAPLALERPQLPESPWKNWTDPLDRLVADYLSKQGFPEPQLISDAVFARRAYLDLWGLLPPPEDLRRFINDTAADKRRRLVSQLLGESRKYAEHWISWWNDLLRNEEGVTYYSETAGRKSITAWLLSALESNTPYDQWVSKLLNPVSPADPDGFLIGVNWRGTVSASQTPALQAAQNTAQVFLGINLKCNSCHDSFISRWKLKDAYSLATFFSVEDELRLYRCDVAQDQFTTAGFLYPELNRPLPSDSAEDRRATAAAIFTDPRNGRMPRTLVNRIWQRLLGRGIVANVDEMDEEPWSPETLDWMASEFVAGGYDIKSLLTTILSSRTYQLAAVPRKDELNKEYVFQGPELRRLTAEQFADAVASITGDWHVVAGGRAGGGGGAVRGGLAGITGAPSDGAGIIPAVRPASGGTPVAGGGAQGAAGQAGAGRRVPVAPAAPVPIPPGNYSREWRIAGSSLGRALGRPIRDQVNSTRDAQATTPQALELVNGESLTHWLWRGARKMLGELPPEPASLVSRQVGGGRPAPAPFDVDVSQSQKLYLIVQDALSTAADKAAPLWIQPELVGPNGTTPLSALTPLDNSGFREGSGGPITVAGMSESNPSAVRVKLSSVLVYDIAGKGFTRFRGAVGFEAVPLSQGENVQGRFFVFDQQPSMDRLVPPNPETPLPPGPVLRSVPEAVHRVYWHALGRAPTPAELRIGEAALADRNRPGRPSAEGLADLLWAVLMTPEFQFIR